MSKSILFYDAVAPKPYTLKDLDVGALGGTEASCLRVAQGLANKGHTVTIAQRNREMLDHDGILYYHTLSHADRAFDTVFTLRDVGVYKQNIARWSGAKHVLWMHDVVGGDYLLHMVQHLKGMKEVNMLCVSEWHRTHTLAALQAYLPDTRVHIDVIYGPLAHYCVKDKTPYDPYKLIFFSSPHKGLVETLGIFSKLHAKDKNFRLYVSNPGYFRSKEDLPEGVISLGTLTHKEVIGHVRTSLCLFYPNPVFPETFGLVMAEADSVGTPVIAHPIGAAPEVVYHPKEIQNCLDHDAVVNTVLRWHNGERLIVQAKKEYSLTGVIKRWEKLL